MSMTILFSKILYLSFSLFLFLSISFFLSFFIVSYCVTGQGGLRGIPNLLRRCQTAISSHRVIQSYPVKVMPISFFLSLSSLTVYLAKGVLSGVPPILKRFQTAISFLLIVHSSPNFQIIKAKSKVNSEFWRFKLHQSTSSVCFVQSKL